MIQKIHGKQGRLRTSLPTRPLASSALWLLLAVSGCATGTWTRGDATAADVDRDSFECRREAARMYPPMPRQVPYGGAENVSRTTCRTKNNVETCDKHTTPAPTYTTDDNDVPRQSAFEACMRAEGYRYQESR
jgi:hypothetical protein